MVRLLDSSEADFYYHWKFIRKKKLTFKFMRDKKIYWQYILILYIHMYIVQCTLYMKSFELYKNEREKFLRFNGLS